MSTKKLGFGLMRLPLLNENDLITNKENLIYEDQSKNNIWHLI